jgi:hypothetical protein
VNLVPWNYLSLSSTYGGAKVHGPIMSNGKEYLDYDVGFFNTQSFHSLELTDKKQVMGRLTWYPMGTTKDRTGFGVTVFEDYGSNGQLPDAHSTPDYRFAAIAHYQTHDNGYELAGEFDAGHNAFSTGNLFSGVGPSGSTYATFSSLASAILAGGGTHQRGFDVFGHARLGHSPFTLFGMYEYFQPNSHVKPDPLDFERTVFGISYKFNKYFTVALDDQNLNYTQSISNLSASQIAMFSPSLAAANPNGIDNPVPQGTNAVFVNMMFNY